MSRVLTPILRVAVPSPLYRSFDYLPPPECDPGRLVPGIRVQVPFGRSRRIGLLVATAERSEIEPQRLKAAHTVLDEHPVLPPDILALAVWAGAYYHHPLGEVMHTVLPARLRQGHPPETHGVRHCRLTPQGRAQDPDALVRAPRQAALLRWLAAHPEGASLEQLAQHPGDWQGALRALSSKGWVELWESPCFAPPAPVTDPLPPPALNEAQRAAVAAVDEHADAFKVFLLDGVTGSGKTEVYLGIIEHVIAQGRQAMVLVPEIGLTPQLVERFRRRFAVPLAVLHSGLSDRERLCAWLMARDGAAPIVIGTRSAVFTPLRAPGVFIVDEEHDPSFKQQEGFRYSARDVAIMRAHRSRVPIALGSATPSLESLHHARRGRYRHLTLPERAGNAAHPQIDVLDLRRQPLQEGLSPMLLRVMDEHIARGEQVLLFLNRRGYAPTLICHDCGWWAECRRCDAHLTLHRGRQRLICHHCGAERPLDRHCPGCGSADLRALGQGTERIEHALPARFPDTGLVRIDRDSTRRKGALQSLLDSVHAGRAQILIGTQMLAKGHHFPEVTLVGVLDADQGLFGADFRAGERMAQLIVQVAGRAGRADKPGRVLIQTHHPDHPLLRTLITQGYHACASAALEERRAAGLPPYSSLALLRAEAAAPQAPQDFLTQARAAAQEAGVNGVDVLGPVPAPQERRAGRYRAHLLLQAARRADLQRLLDTWVPQLETLKAARRVRWSLDVDPVEML